MLPFEAFLALRYLRPRRTFVSVITVISVIGVMLGVAVLIIVIAVMSGMDKEWRDRILGFDAHLKIYSLDGSALTNYAAMMKQIGTNQNVAGVSPFIRDQALVKTELSEEDTNFCAALFFGADPGTLAGVSDLPGSIVQGSFDMHEQGMLIGIEFARALGLHVGDRLAIYSPGSLQKMARAASRTNEERVAPEEFTVRGIFDAGFNDYNNSIVVASLQDARALYQLPAGGVTGIYVKLRDPFLADEVARQLADSLQEPARIMTWREEHSVIFSALAVEKNMMFFILFFIMVVAAFGIVNCQITFVVQKTREIGILKALGATNWQVLTLFLSQSVAVGVFGVGLGFGLAVAALHYRNEFLHLMRQVTHTALLPASIYHVYDLPAVIQTSDALVICGTAFVTCVLGGLFPAWKAARLQPVEALRHE
ncbi:MAG: ABC transporter permease [Verrucomicrobiota bacterium]|jgi:lipoprotein-releasing system permease protein